MTATTPLPYRAGWSAQAIADRLGCLPSTIYRRLEDAGVPRRPASVRVSRQDLIEGLDRGMSAPDIAAAVGVSVSCVWRTLALRSPRLARTGPWRRCSAESGQLAMVAVHTWDVHGAARPGLAGGWESCLEGAYPPTFDPPDVSGRTLVKVVEGILALADGPTAGSRADVAR